MYYTEIKKRISCVNELMGFIDIKNKNSCINILKLHNIDILKLHT